MFSAMGIIQRAFEKLPSTVEFKTGFLYPGSAVGDLNNPDISELVSGREDAGLSRWKIWTGTATAGDGLINLSAGAMATLFIREPFGNVMKLDVSNLTDDETPGLALFVKDTTNYFVAYASKSVTSSFSYTCVAFGFNAFLSYFSGSSYFRSVNFSVISFRPLRYGSSASYFRSTTYTRNSFYSTGCSSFNAVYTTSVVKQAIVDRVLNGNVTNIITQTFTGALATIEVLISYYLNSTSTPDYFGITRNSRSVYPTVGYPYHFKVWFKTATGTNLVEENIMDPNINASFAGTPQHNHGIRNPSGAKAVTAITVENPSISDGI